MGLQEALDKMPDTDTLDDILRRGGPEPPTGGLPERMPEGKPLLETQFYHDGAAPVPLLAGPPKSIYFAVPASSIDPLALPSITMPSRHPVRMVPTRGAAGGFNHLWCNALNCREPLKLTHFAMHHSDIGAPIFWLDFLLEEMDRVGADIISCCVAIKDDRGLTSTAVRNNTTRHIRRLTMHEIAALPDTFALKDIPWADPENDALLLNNALWCCRFDSPWVEEVTFHFIEWNFRNSDGRFQAGFFSEDWQFSEWATVRGLKLFATHKIPIVHAGKKDWECNGKPWGDWKEEQGDLPRI